MVRADRTAATPEQEHEQARRARGEPAAGDAGVPAVALRGTSVGVLALQRAAGNQAVSALVGGAGSRAPIVQRFESREHAEIGDQVHTAVGATAGTTGAERERLAADTFTDGQRSLSLDLRVRDPATGLPAESGKQTVPLSYGEMVAMSGDLYFSVDNMRKAPAQEVIALRDLVALERREPHGHDFDGLYEGATAWRREGVYQPGTGSREGSKGQYWGVQPGDAAHDDASTYLDLATGNVAHFSAATGAVATPGGPEGNAAADNHQAFLTDHGRAIAIATEVREAKKRLGQIPGSAAAPATPGAAAPAGAGGATDIKAQENLAYVYNAGGDHYLTDAFSSGHLINKGLLAPVTDKVMTPDMFDSMVEALMPFAMREPAALGLSPDQLGTGGGAAAGAVIGGIIFGPLGAVIGGALGGYGGHKGIQHVVRGKLRDGLSVFKTDPFLRHNVGAKLVHDYLNASGAKVVSKNGRFSYVTMGDAHMDPSTQDVAARAVLASRNYIRALMNDSDADLAKPENADDAWEYTPNIDVTLFTSQMEPILRAELANTPHLWELMKTAVRVKEDRAKQDKAEASTAASARKDTGGDWGQQPNPRFTRRMITTTDSARP
jgi:hypothetical protein